MDVLNHWLSLIHPLLEALYYMSAVALTILAFKGLEQLKISKEIARINAKREAFKLAAQECRYFAEHVVPLNERIFNEIVTLNLSSFLNPQFTIKNGEIITHNFSMPVLASDLTKCRHSLVEFLNSLEAFSIFFAARIAEESVAYQETGETFCIMARQFMPGIFFLRTTRSGRFESTVMLYERWSSKQRSEQLIETKKNIDKNLEGLRQEPLKPIGTE